MWWFISRGFDRTCQGSFSAGFIPPCCIHDAFCAAPPPRSRQRRLLTGSFGTAVVISSQVIKEVRAITGLGLREAKEMVESLPQVYTYVKRLCASCLLLMGLDAVELPSRAAPVLSVLLSQAIRHTGTFAASGRKFSRFLFFVFSPGDRVVASYAPRAPQCASRPVLSSLPVLFSFAFWLLSFLAVFINRW